MVKAMTKIRNVVGILCVVIICVAGIIGQQWHPSDQDRTQSAAESLYPTLAGFGFDEIEVLESEKQILLYKYKKIPHTVINESGG